MTTPIQESLARVSAANARFGVDVAGPDDEPVMPISSDIGNDHD